MYQTQLYSKITRRFFPKGDRFQCQFRDHGSDQFTTDCAYNDYDLSLSYICLVVRFVSKVAEGRVVDRKSKQVIFVCQKPVRFSPKRRRFVREVPDEYAQLALTGFDASGLQKGNARRKKKVDQTFAKLRKLHDELNTQLYAKPTERPSIHSPNDVYEILKCFIGNLDHEELWVVNLDTRNRVMNLIALYKGSVNSSQIRVAEVFRQAITDNAPSIIVSHNHPSGDPAPSPEDVAVTRSIVQAGKLLDIDVLDHIIVCSSRYASLKERGLGF